MSTSDPQSSSEAEVGSHHLYFIRGSIKVPSTQWPTQVALTARDSLTYFY